MRPWTGGLGGNQSLETSGPALHHCLQLLQPPQGHGLTPLALGLFLFVNKNI